MLRKNSLLGSSPDSQQQLDDKKGKKVGEFLRKHIVESGSFDNLIRKLSLSNANTEKEQRLEVYADLCWYLDNLATMNGVRICRQQLGIYEKIKEKDPIIPILYVRNILKDMQAAKAAVVPAVTHVHNGNSYSLLNGTQLNFTFGGGDGSSEVLGMVGSVGKYMIESLPELFRSVKEGGSKFVKRLSSFWKAASASLSPSSSSSSSAVSLLQIESGICLFNAFMKWKKCRKNKLLMFDYVPYAASENLKELKAAESNEAYIKVIKDLMLIAYSTDLVKTQQSGGGEMSYEYSNELEQAFVDLESRDGDPLENIQSRGRRLRSHYHLDKMIGRSQEDIEFAQREFQRLTKALERIDNYYEKKKGMMKQGEENNGQARLAFRQSLSIEGGSGGGGQNN